MGLTEDDELVHALFGEADGRVLRGPGEDRVGRGSTACGTRRVRKRRARARGHRRRGAVPRLPEQQRAAVGRGIPVPRHHAAQLRRRRADLQPLAGRLLRVAARPAGRRWRSCSRTTSTPRSRRRAGSVAPAWPGHAPDRRPRPALLPRPPLRPDLGRVRRPGFPVTFHSGGTPWEGQGLAAMWVHQARVPVVGAPPALAVHLRWRVRALPRSAASCSPSRAPTGSRRCSSRLDEQYLSPFERGITDHLHKSPSGYWARQLLRRRVVHEPRRVR